MVKEIELWKTWSKQIKKRIGFIILLVSGEVFGECISLNVVS